MKARYIFLFCLLFYLPPSFGYNMEALRRAGLKIHMGTFIKRLKDKNEDINLRVEAAEDLGIIGGKRAVSALKEASLRDPSKKVRAKAASVLGVIGSKEVVSALKEALGDSRRDERARAAGILGKIGGEEAVLALREASLRDSSKKVRTRATNVLNKIECRRAIVKPNP